MGLGKTVQLLALEASNRSHGKRPPDAAGLPDVGGRQLAARGGAVRPGLCACTSTTARTGRAATRCAKPCESNDLVLTTYALAARDADALSELAWDRRRARRGAEHQERATPRRRRPCARSRRGHRVALTGTPVENRLAELWSIMDFVNPGLLGTVDTFRARFAVPIERHGDEDAAARLRKITGPVRAAPAQDRPARSSPTCPTRSR